MSKAEDMYLTCFLDGRARNISIKEAFNMGYSLAEKDNALTWEDMRDIYDLAYNLRFPHKKQKVFFEEVLKRFLEQKEGKV